jgi:hypothetical protein
MATAAKSISDTTSLSRHFAFRFSRSRCYKACQTASPTMRLLGPVSGFCSIFRQPVLSNQASASSALEGDYLKVIRSVRLSVVAFGFKGSFVVFLSS